jgi:hypothetical protein
MPTVPILRPVATVLASLLLAAHLLRSGGPGLAAVAAALPLLLLVRRSWATRALQLALAAGSLEWLRTLAALVDLRRGQGEPWLRMAAILGAVALVTAGAAALLGTGRVGRRQRPLAEAA